MQWMIVMIEREMNGAIAWADADDRDVMCVIATEAIILKADDFPLVRAAFATCNANASGCIIIGRVLKIFKCCERVLLETLPVYTNSPRSVRKVQRGRIDYGISNLLDGHFRHRVGSNAEEQ